MIEEISAMSLTRSLCLSSASKLFLALFICQFTNPLESKNKIAVSAKTVRYFLPIGIFRQRKLNFLSLFFSVCFFFFEPRAYSFSFIFFFFLCYPPLIFKNYFFIFLLVGISGTFYLFTIYLNFIKQTHIQNSLTL